MRWIQCYPWRCKLGLHRSPPLLQLSPRCSKLGDILSLSLPYFFTFCIHSPFIRKGCPYYGHTKKGNDGATPNAGGHVSLPYVIYYTYLLHNVNICQHLMPSFAIMRLTVPVCTPALINNDPIFFKIS